MKTVKEYTKIFHNTYEELAPKFGYITREETKEFNTTTSNGLLMISVVEKVLGEYNQEILKVIDNMKTNIKKDFDVDDPTGNLIVQSNLHILELLKIAIEME